MSFVNSIRDYIELLTNLYDSIGNDINLQKIIQETFLYFFGSLKYIFIYFISFQWIKDLSYLPIVIPQISNSIVKETFFLESPLSNFFGFLELPSYSGNKFFIGFLNSFFLALPLSCAHLVVIRRLLIQGTIAGITAGLGNILGQILFLFFTIFGIRFFIVSWFSLEPLNFILGFSLIFYAIYKMVHERAIKIIQLDDSSTLAKIFLLNFFLSWTEQSVFFHYIGNLTINSEPTLLETFSPNTSIEFFINHLFYLSGILIGSVFFYIIIGFIIKKSTDFVQTKFNILRSTWVIQLNFIVLTIILSFTFVSIPFYGFDYLITGPLGFVSQDRSFKNTFLSPNEAVDPYRILSAFSFDTDISPFDRGSYLRFPLLQNFEDLNYGAEYALTSRQGKISLFGQYKEKARKVTEGLKLKKQEKNERVIIDEQTKSFTNDQSEKKMSINLSEKIDYPTFITSTKDIYRLSNIKKRFENEYKDLKNTTFLNIANFSLNSQFFLESSEFLSIPQKLIKKLNQKYYSNPIYKFLLVTDIDNFLSRQPKEYLLSGKEEKELYKKRLILGYYHDSLRFYKILPYFEEFQFLVNGSKSFADRIYNQQFKGTLSVVRRLFLITTNPKTNKLGELILKYDQPLFNKINEKNIFLHEELEQFPKKVSPFFELTNTIPLYLGWDESSRKLIVTNRLLSRYKSGFLDIEKINSNSKEYNFSSWPIKKSSFNNLEKKSLKPYRFLFVNKNNLKNSDNERLIDLFQYQGGGSEIASYQNLPENLFRLSREVRDILPPNRGGFLWPGDFPLQISFSDLLGK